MKPRTLKPHRLRLVLLLLLLALLIRQEGPPPGSFATGVSSVIADVRFDFWGWEAHALGIKFAHWLLQPQRYMQKADRTAFVRDYMDRIQFIHHLEARVGRIYADPNVTNPEAATADLRLQIHWLRQKARARQPVAEAILEEQVGTVLAAHGLGLLGQPLPPIGARFTPLPLLLVVSPRERIEAIFQQELQHGLDLAYQETIEERIDRTFDVSSLVTPIGGMSAWPAMLLESADLAWVAEATAHEWTHHYLGFYPLGWEYDRSQQARTINETVASIVGKEVGRELLARYYPDLLPPEEGPKTGPTEPPAFDFRAEMHKTRVEVDRLLAEGRVEEAERYMEARRRFFWEHGYRIRKLNQAYFAFYGSYAAEPGAAGEDPIGPLVRRLREESSSLRVFLREVRGITSLEQLRRVVYGGSEQ